MWRQDVPSYLNLSHHLPKDVRSKVYGMFDKLDIDMVQRAHGMKRSNFETRRLALYYGRLEILIWIKQKGCKFNADSCETASEYGHLHVLKWLHDNHVRLSDKTIVNAARNGHVHVLDWIPDESQLPNYDKATSFTAFSGHINVLEWIINRHFNVTRTNQGDWWNFVCLAATECGHLHVLKWAVNLKDTSILNHTMCWRAASKGFLDILIWMKEIGIEMDALISIEAAYHGHYHVIKWCIQNDVTVYTDECVRLANEKLEYYRRDLRRTKPAKRQKTIQKIQSYEDIVKLILKLKL